MDEIPILPSVVFANHEFAQLNGQVRKTVPTLITNVPVLVANEDTKFPAPADYTTAVDFPHPLANIPQVQNLAGFGKFATTAANLAFAVSPSLFPAATQESVAVASCKDGTLTVGVNAPGSG